MESNNQIEEKKHMQLPVNVVSVSDVGHLLRELESIENHLLQLKVRDGGTQVSLPNINKRMEKLLEINGLNILQDADREKLNKYLSSVKADAPVLHISFSSEPTPSFLEKLMVWIRREINPDVLLTIGLQPAIGAGCMLRTTNKYFDMSLRQTFIDKRPLLLEQIIPPAPQIAEAPTQ